MRCPPVLRLLGDLCFPGAQQPPSPLPRTVVTHREPRTLFVRDSAPPAPTGALFPLKAGMPLGKPNSGFTLACWDRRPTQELASAPCTDARPCSASFCHPRARGRLGAARREKQRVPGWCGGTCGTSLLLSTHRLMLSACPGAHPGLGVSPLATCYGCRMQLHLRSQTNLANVCLVSHG